MRADITVTEDEVAQWCCENEHREYAYKYLRALGTTHFAVRVKMDGGKHQLRVPAVAKTDMAKRMQQCIKTLRISLHRRVRAPSETPRPAPRARPTPSSPLMLLSWCSPDLRRPCSLCIGRSR